MKSSKLVLPFFILNVSNAFARQDIEKGVLQHSRSGTGAKEPTDINSLADKYLHLSYHAIRAKDGIPKNIVDKIFHAFFTTKPTGQGTGLGFGLAYDIVKAHGGEIKVKTGDTPIGRGSAFIIQIPFKKIL